MKIFLTALATSALLGIGVANAQSGPITCADLPQATAFVAKLRPGPNTRAAEQHLDAARNAQSDDQCVAELKQVDTYARRSAEADRRAARVHHAHVLCADAMHQDRPGGTDYHGPPVRGCPRPKI